MEGIIKEIIAIDKRAKEICRESNSEETDIKKAVETKKAELLKEMNARQNARIEKMKELENKILENKSTQIETETNLTLEKMEAEFSKNKSEFEQKMTDAVISVLD